MTPAFAHSTTASARRVADEIRAALAQRERIRIAGAGCWLDAGSPVNAARCVSLAHDAGIIEYEPGDLTLTALAGTSLGEIERTCAAERQWLPLDPPGSAAGTIGATVVTGSYGPLAHAYGGPRDQVLGVEFVNGHAETVRGGGRVTKNVAGFDLTRLICGSWGTLGVVTEITVRLRALPEVDRTLALHCSATSASLTEMLRRVRAASVSAVAMELIDEAWAAELALGGGSLLLVRLCGNENGVRVQEARVRSVANAVECPGDVWERIRGDDETGRLTFRMSSRPGRLPEIWDFAASMRVGLSGLRARASIARGVVRVSAASKDAGDLASLLAERPAGGLVLEKLPPDVWKALAMEPENDAGLGARVRNAFDPHHILNAGILGEPVA